MHAYFKKMEGVQKGGIDQKTFMAHLFFYPMLRIKVFFISHGLTQLAIQWYLYITFDKGVRVRMRVWVPDPAWTAKNLEQSTGEKSSR